MVYCFPKPVVGEEVSNSEERPSVRGPGEISNCNGFVCLIMKLLCAESALRECVCVCGLNQSKSRCVGQLE